MEYYRYFQDVLEFQVDVQSELTQEDRDEMCSHFGISSRKLADELKLNSGLFQYESKREGPKGNQSWNYYITLIGIQQARSNCSGPVGYHASFEVMEYLNLKVIFNKETQFINVTNLCEQNGKRFRHWYSNHDSQKLISVFKEKIGNDVIERIENESNFYRGTYMHRSLVPHLASWLSPEFAFKVSEIVNDYINRENKLKLMEKDKTIEELKDNMNQLKIINLQQSAQIDEMLNNTRQLIVDNKQLMSDNKQLLTESKETQHKLDSIIVTIGRLE